MFITSRVSNLVRSERLETIRVELQLAPRVCRKDKTLAGLVVGKRDIHFRFWDGLPVLSI